MSKKIKPFPPMYEWSDEALKQLGWSLSEDAKQSEEIMRVRELVKNHKGSSSRLYSAGTQTSRLSSSEPNTSREPKKREAEVELTARYNNSTLKITSGSIYYGFPISSTGLVVIRYNDDLDTVVLPLSDFNEVE
ncbi:hypothetical protein [Bacillus phage phiAGATE]|uniref:Uncharacterized protein n=1 Tax=Bacillus phage phiAGATE TaxID=1204533 RepID=L0L981_9CAUD|nr:hypothetical protein G380_gp053 [Bacillus phage phiAGATE]AGB62703.1 hypothetical protein [Bacillus phage phiAGATE]